MNNTWNAKIENGLNSAICDECKKDIEFFMASNRTQKRWDGE